MFKTEVSELTLTLQKTLPVEPTLFKDLSDREDPKLKKSSTEKYCPIEDVPNIEATDP
jgi:hypothetical protein